MVPRRNVSNLLRAPLICGRILLEAPHVHGHSAEALIYLIGLVGTDRVVLGSDYYFDISYEHPFEMVTKHVEIDDEATDLNLANHAKPLLGL